MKKVICVFGTRPEAIKMIPVVCELKKNSRSFKTKVILTAQHRGMLDQVMKLFGVKADYDLNIMKKAQGLEYITTKVLLGIQQILKKEKPDLVLVHGDTTTTFSAALAAFYEKIPVGHVEAGLRSYDKFNPYPEEMNRKLTDSICDIHFVHTESAKRNLRAENVKSSCIYVTGNTVIDALFLTLKKEQGYKNNILNKLDPGKRLLLVTAHRRENWGQPLKNICLALKEINRMHKDIEIVYSVHLNPNVTGVAMPILEDIKGVYLTEPLDYVDFVKLMKKSYLILTDSGGIQEEAPSLGKPVLVLRKVTERPEAVKAGTVKVIGTEKNRIIRETSKLLNDNKAYNRMQKAINPYGDGKAAKRIVAAIRDKKL